MKFARWQHIRRRNNKNEEIIHEGKRYNSLGFTDCFFFVALSLSLTRRIQTNPRVFFLLIKIVSHWLRMFVQPTQNIHSTQAVVARNRDYAMFSVQFSNYEN